jgi:hypothetical protein
MFFGPKTGFLRERKSRPKSFRRITQQIKNLHDNVMSARGCSEQPGTTE